MTDLAKFIPINRQEHENELRTIIGKHIPGNTGGNPTQWVVDAVAEAYQAGFGLGFYAGSLPRKPKDMPAFKVQMPDAGDPGQARHQHDDAQRRALPMAERIDKETP